MNRLFLLIVAIALIGCDKPHPATDTVGAFTDALRYGDRDGLFSAHVDSTQQGEFCRMEFRKLLERAKALSEDGCTQVRQLTATSREMPDELQLAAQTGRWACENPDGTCVDYARTVFDQALEKHSLVKAKPRTVNVAKVIGDETTAVAYLDVVDTEGKTSHRTVELKFVGEGWRVAGGFLNE